MSKRGCRARVTPRQLFSLLTVETLCLMIERRREGGQ